MVVTEMGGCRLESDPLWRSILPAKGSISPTAAIPPDLHNLQKPPLLALVVVCLGAVAVEVSVEVDRGG
jgi:hypothetical protein